MSFLAFQVIFAALAIGLLAVAILLARRLWGTRQPRASRPPRETASRAPKPERPGLGRKKAADPAPEPAAAPPARRRQLASFAESERIVGGSEAQQALKPMDEPVAPEPLPAAELPAPPDSDLGEAVLGRLEAAFDALQAGQISLDLYRERVRAEEAALDRHIATLPESEEDELEAALAARESVRWCLGWADEQRGRKDG